MKQLSSITHFILSLLVCCLAALTANATIPEAEKSVNIAPLHSLTARSPAVNQHTTTEEPSHIAYGWNSLGGSSGVGVGFISINLSSGQIQNILPVPTSQIWMTGGDFVDGVYYATSYHASNSGLYQINVSNGTYTLVGGAGVALNGLAYDVVRKKLYGVGSTSGTSYLYALSLTTGQAQLIGPICEGVIAGIASNALGEVFGLNLSSNSLYSIDPLSGQGTMTGELGFAINYAQDIGFDRDNNILYGALYSSFSIGGLYTISTETGATHLINNYFAEVTAIGVPYTITSEDAPGLVADFLVEEAPLGELGAQISWTNPSVTQGGTDLGEISAVIIKRNEETVFIFTDASPGESQVFYDNTIEESGLYTYRIYAENAFGAGLSRELRVFAGEDVPAGPTAVVVDSQENNALISWDDPVSGLNGHYFSGDNLVYEVVRLPDYFVFQAVQANQLLDTGIPDAGLYQYRVTARSHMGSGGSAFSDQIYLATSDLLIFEPFDGYNQGSLPTAWGIQGTPHGWSVMHSSNAGGLTPELRLNWEPPLVGLSRLGTHTVPLGSHQRLRIRFNHYLSNYFENDGEMVGVDVSYDQSDTWQPVWEQEVTATIPATIFRESLEVPPGKESIALGFRFDGDSYNINEWYIDNLILEPVFDNDLAAVKLEGYIRPTADNEYEYLFTIENLGSDPQTDYQLHLYLDFEVVASLPGQTILPGQTLSYAFHWTPLIAQIGSGQLHAHIALETDNRPGNNYSKQLALNILPPDTEAILVGDGNLMLGLPYHFNYHYSLSQTLYYPHEIDHQGGEIKAISYFNHFEESLYDKSVKIWMGEVSQNNLEGGWLDATGLTLVFDGFVDFPQGANEIYIPLDNGYVYNGGTLLIHSYKADHTFTPSNGFYNSLDAGSKRSILGASDFVPMDPMTEPEYGQINDRFPNIAFYFSSSGLGRLEGTITHQGSPLQGVTISIPEANQLAVSDEAGNYVFNYLKTGNYTLVLSRHAYFDQSIEGVQIHENQVTILDVDMEQIPLVAVSGRVTGNDNPEQGIAGASVELSGYAGHSVQTDEAGYFVLEQVYSEQPYLLKVFAFGYALHQAPLQAESFSFDLGDIMLSEVAYPVINVKAEEEEDGALVSWMPGIGGLVTLFQYDESEPENPNAFYQAQNMVYGTIFDLSGFPDAHLANLDFHHLQWGLPNGQYDFLVHVVDWETKTRLAILGPYTTSENNAWEKDIDLGALDVSGYSQIAILLQPQGHLLNNAYPVFTADGTGPGGLSVFAPADNLHNFSINGSDMGDYFITLRIITAHYSFDPKVPTERKIMSLHPGSGLPASSRRGEHTASAVVHGIQQSIPAEKAWLNYRVYRLMQGQEDNMSQWTPLSMNHTSLFYLDQSWASLEPGYWKYAVVAEHTGGMTSEPAFSNTLANGLFASAAISVSTNSGDTPEGATVTLSNSSDPGLFYSGQVDYEGMLLFDEVIKGTYNLKVSLSGYSAYSEEDIAIFEHVNLHVLLKEIIITPHALYVEKEGFDPGNALFSWEHGFSEFRHDDGTLSGQIGTAQGTIRSVFGSVHHEKAALHEMSWFLTSEGGPHNTVALWVLGLTENGLPDRNNIVFTAGAIPNEDNTWNTYAFDELLHFENGFFIGIGYEGFIGVGHDDGQGAPYDFVPQTHYFVGDITSNAYAFSPIEEFGFHYNLMIRARGIKHDQKHPQPAREKQLLGYNVFLNGIMAEQGQQESSILFTGLEDGLHKAGVQAAYSSGTSDIAEIYFVMGTFTGEYQVVFLPLDAYGDEVPDAVISLGTMTNEPGDYTFEDVPAGLYTYSLSGDCFPLYQGVMLVMENTLQEVLLEGIAGDANGDGLVNTLDASSTAAFIIGNQPPLFCFANADAVPDQTINILDIIQTLNFIPEKYELGHDRQGKDTEPASLYLSENGISLESHGNISGLQIKLSGTFLHDMDVLLHPQGFDIDFRVLDNSLWLVVYNVHNHVLPAGHIQLLSFETATPGPFWIHAMAGNAGAAEVPVLLHDATGVSATDDDTGFNVFPNPASGTFYVAFNNTIGDAALMIFSSEGRLMFRRDDFEPGYVLQPVRLQGIAAGNYVIVLYHNGIKHQKSLIISH